MNSPALSVVIPFRDRAAETCRCLDSVLAQKGTRPCEVVLVDNDSRLLQVERVRSHLARISLKSQVKWVAYPQTFNHSRQCMMGVEASEGEVIVFLNNDVVLETPTLLEEMATWSLTPGVATVGCRLIASKGRKLICAGMRIRAGRSGFWVEESDEVDGAEEVRETVGNTFACCAVSKETLARVGPLDAEHFPNGYNDVEFCLRARRAGYRHMVLGSLTAFHRPATSRGASDERSPRDRLRRLYPECEKEAANLWKDQKEPTGWRRLKNYLGALRRPADLR